MNSRIVSHEEFATYRIRDLSQDEIIAMRNRTASHYKTETSRTTTVEYTPEVQRQLQEFREYQMSRALSGGLWSTLEKSGGLNIGPSSYNSLSSCISFDEEEENCFEDEIPINTPSCPRFEYLLR